MANIRKKLQNIPLGFSLALRVLEEVCYYSYELIVSHTHIIISESAVALSM